jgi:hypothetical protein
MNGKFRKAKLYFLFVSLILGIGLIGCGPTIAGADDLEPTDIPVTDTVTPAPIVEPTASPMDTKPISQDEEDIREALATHLGFDAGELTVIVEENTGTHARGGVNNGYFLAAKANGNWVIVADGQGVMDCAAIMQYGFPNSMVPECSDSVSDESAIRSALAAHLGVDTNGLSVTIKENTGTHARGNVDNGYFLAAKVNENWMIVADGQGVIDCNAIAQYTFPASMVPECAGSSSADSPIKAALAEHLGVDASTLTVVVGQETGTHARGNVDNGYFLAAKVNGNWVIVADGQGAIDCAVVAQYAFPTSVVPECGD